MGRIMSWGNIATAATWLTAVLLLSSGSARAEDSYVIEVYTARRASGPVIVDGKLNEESWRAADAVSGFVHYDGPQLADPQTQVRVTYDDQALYFGVKCYEPLIDSVRAVPAARDSKDVFRGETVEMFVDPGHTHQTYYQFAVSCAGSIYDSRAMDRVWNSHAHVATHLETDGWTVETAIPWSDLGQTPSAGGLLGFNVCRDRQVGTPQWSTWSRVEANFHDPVRFAHLVLSPDKGFLAGIEPALRKGDRRGPIRVYTSEGYYGTADTTYRQLVVRQVSGLEQTLDELRSAGAPDSSAAVDRQLGALIHAYQARMEPLVQIAAGPGPLEAATYYQTRLRADALSRELQGLVWEARLRALLSRI